MFLCCVYFKINIYSRCACLRVSAISSYSSDPRQLSCGYPLNVFFVIFTLFSVELRTYFPKKLIIQCIKYLVQGDNFKFSAIIGDLILPNARFIAIEIFRVWYLLSISCLTFPNNSSSAGSVDTPCWNLYCFCSKIYLLFVNGRLILPCKNADRRHIGL